MKDMTLHINFPKYDTFWADAENMRSRRISAKRPVLLLPKLITAPAQTLKVSRISVSILFNILGNQYMQGPKKQLEQLNFPKSMDSILYLFCSDPRCIDIKLFVLIKYFLCKYIAEVHHCIHLGGS